MNRPDGLTGPPVVRNRVLYRPIPLAVDEIIVRDGRGRVLRRAFWGRGAFEPTPWADLPS